MKVPQSIEQNTPDFLRRIGRRWRLERTRRHFKALIGSAPIGDVFAEVYRTKAWGGSEGEAFNSGEGSEHRFAAAYAAWVNQFVIEQALHDIVDLGCGDFRVGRLLNTSREVGYTGIDVVADLIRSHQERFQNAYIEFRCANIIEDELPSGDLCLIRQVLQHLSNNQISRILNACSKYRYVLVTEDVFVGPKGRPNLDMPAGFETRGKDRSGVFLDLPPFNLPLRTVLKLKVPAIRFCGPYCWRTRSVPWWRLRPRAEGSFAPFDGSVVFPRNPDNYNSPGNLPFRLCHLWLPKAAGSTLLLIALQAADRRRQKTTFSDDRWPQSRSVTDRVRRNGQSFAAPQHFWVRTTQLAKVCGVFAGQRICGDVSEAR
jgi:Methyltransferase domain